MCFIIISNFIIIFNTKYLFDFIVAIGSDVNYIRIKRFE